MKSLHRPDLFAWSSFDEARNVDFNGTFWQRDEGNVVFDPMPMGEHDLAHAHELGGIAWILITNTDHIRAAGETALIFGAKIAGPLAEKTRPAFEGLTVDRWLDEGDDFLGARVFRVSGSKTPGELAFLLGDTLITGDLIRGQRAGCLNLLPDKKLADRQAALDSVRRLAEHGPSAVLVGDGQSVFRHGVTRLMEIG